ncbi:hypothetical protein ABT117_23030 [Streptomyces sp. NPDC002262]|uniref:hypothetical protein n=1 Tax=Streptomyces sp. NPDC002262 TaxID=3154414 RepID=UPI003320C5A9
MQIHRIPKHDREFVIIANKAIQDPRLSHTARGILALVLSLPNGVRENVRTLSDNYPQGRRAVESAVAELRLLGYWVTRTVRDRETRRIVSTVDVYELPPAPVPGAPVPTRPVIGPEAAENAGASPYGEKDGERDGGKQGEGNPPFPPAPAPASEPAPAPASVPVAPDLAPALAPAPAAPKPALVPAPASVLAAPKPAPAPASVPAPVAPASVPAASAPAPASTVGPEPTPGAAQEVASGAYAAEAARVLRRLASVDARLGLSARQVAELVPAVADWLDRGATVTELLDALTQGLPRRLYSARAVIADRLDRKRPARRRRWKTYADCADGCGGLLPEGQDSGSCHACSGTERPGAEPSGPASAPLPETPPGPLAPEGFAVFRAARTALSGGARPGGPLVPRAADGVLV